MKFQILRSRIFSSESHARDKSDFGAFWPFDIFGVTPTKKQYWLKFCIFWSRVTRVIVLEIPCDLFTPCCHARDSNLKKNGSLINFMFKSLNLSKVHTIRRKMQERLCSEFVFLQRQSDEKYIN
jgi:hypothetical protein